AEVLRDLQGEVVLVLGDAGVRDLEGVQDLRELAVGELDVDDGTDDLDDTAVSESGRGGHSRGRVHGAGGSFDVVDALLGAQQSEEKRSRRRERPRSNMGRLPVQREPRARRRPDRAAAERSGRRGAERVAWSVPADGTA